MGIIELEYAVPAADIADFVTLFYHFRADVPVFEDIERADQAQLRFNLGSSSNEYHMTDGAVHNGGRVHIVGPTSGAVRSRVVGPVRVFGMAVSAVGWAVMIGRDASTMLDRVADARDLLNAPLFGVADALAAAPDTAAMVAIVEPMIRSLAVGRGGDAIEFVQQVRAWLGASTSADVESLVAATGLSQRQVERRCKALYGVSPKLLARKYRALRAAAALLVEGATATDLISYGFYDQSHLIREIKHFTGMTPRKILSDTGRLAQLTTAQRFALGEQVAPLVRGS